jgi:hypothetical protein
MARSDIESRDDGKGSIAVPVSETTSAVRSSDSDLCKYQELCTKPLTLILQSLFCA